LIAPGSTVHTVALSTRYPCVLKPLGLAGSRGVIRANHADEFVQAFARIRKILDGAQSAGTGHLPAGSIQVEDFIPGREFALEGLVTDGRLQVLAIFDKPDPLDGPYFEETIYRTPSHEPESIQREIVRTTERAVTALGLTSGPIHAEMRVNESGVWMLEVAARPIGGLCSRVLRFDRNRSLEELILLHALGPVPSDEVSSATLSPGSHGVMMIPFLSQASTRVSTVSKTRAPSPGLKMWSSPRRKAKCLSHFRKARVISVSSFAIVLATSSPFCAHPTAACHSG